MKKKNVVPLVVLAALCAVVAGAIFLVPVLQEQRLNARARTLVSGMSVDEKLGQVLLMNFRFWGEDADGNSLPLEVCNDTVRDVIGKYHIGNVILFEENTADTEKAVRFVEALQQASASVGGLPLLIGIDQEGGMVTRLGQGTCLPGNMALGASGDAKNALLAGSVIGEELTAIGVNCDFAPVCDVNDNPKNPVINLRSFSSDPEVVGNMARALRQGLQDSGVISAAKHFPGHGNTAVDTHVGLAVVEKSRADWEAVEAKPFREMIESGQDMIMSAHIQYPQLDDTKYQSKLTGEELTLPATLSHTILTDILRGELGYDGVIVTDALDMKAIADNFGEAEACVMALSAGADLLCNPVSITGTEDVSKLDMLYETVHAALSDGRLSPERLEEAAFRVMRLKLKYGILDGKQDSRTVEEKVEHAVSVVGSPAHRQTERLLAEAAVTLYGDAPYVPMKPREGERVLFLVPYENKGFAARYAMDRLMREGKLPKVEADIFLYNEQTAVSAEAVTKIKQADYVVLVTVALADDLAEPEGWPLQTPKLLAQAVKEEGKESRCAVLSAGMPDDAVNFSGLPVYVVYGYQGMREKDSQTGMLTGKYGPNIPAGIDSIMGVFAPTGKLPVRVG